MRWICCYCRVAPRARIITGKLRYKSLCAPASFAPSGRILNDVFDPLRACLLCYIRGANLSPRRKRVSRLPRKSSRLSIASSASDRSYLTTAANKSHPACGRWAHNGVTSRESVSLYRSYAGLYDVTTPTGDVLGFNLFMPSYLHLRQ